MLISSYIFSYVKY